MSESTPRVAADGPGPLFPPGWDVAAEELEHPLEYDYQDDYEEDVVPHAAEGTPNSLSLEPQEVRRHPVPEDSPGIAGADGGSATRGTEANRDAARVRQPGAGEDRSSSTTPAGDPIPYGVREIGGLAVPDRLRFDQAFLSRPRGVQMEILRYIRDSDCSVVPPPLSRQTVAKTVPLWEGQVEALDAVIERTMPYEEDKRRSLTRNHLLRVMVDVNLGEIVPFMDLRRVSTEAGLREEFVHALRRFADETRRSVLP